MKPTIALSLSFEGIGLLCRVREGWHLIGEVPLGAEDLAADLQALRDMAEQSEGADFRSKLVLPNDQIKYLALDTGRLSRSRREAAAVAALEESTPYQAQDLAYDIVAKGRITHVAAVARETLAEAEAFAVEHAFNPLCFVAIPPEGEFPGEPVFGLTEAAKTLLNGATLEQDTAVIRITGSGPLAAQAELDLEAAPEEPRPAPAEPASAAPAAQVREDTAAPETAQKAAESACDATAKNGRAASGTPPEARPETRQENWPENQPETLPEMSPETAPGAAPEAPQPETAAAEATEAPVSAFSSIRARRDDGGTPAATTLGAAERSVAGTNAPGLPAATLPRTPHSEAPLHFDPASVIAGLRSSPEPDEPEAAETAGNGRASKSFFSRHRGKADKAGKPEATAAAETHKEAAPPQSERHRLTMFGARDGAVRGKPRHLGLVLTLILLAFLAGVALWASLFLDEGLAGLLRREPVPQIAELEVESTQIEAEAVETAALAPVGADSVTDSAEIEALEEAAEELIDSAEIEAETDIIHPSALSEIEAEARYAVTGIWQRAPHQSETPPLDSTDTLYVTSIDRLLATRDAVALTETRLHARQDQPMARPNNPPPAGTRFELDANGLVQARPEGAMAPSGVMVYLGRPAALPGSFPERQPAPGLSFTPETIALFARKRPRARPDGLIESNQRASYGGRTLTELASLRPRPRPALSKAEEEKETTPTEAAVLTSARPRSRPDDFAQTVASATPRDPVTATPAAAAAVAVAPSIPSSASVARQATIQNAISLNKISLIGVYGTTSSRRALVRLSNGRFKKVQVGDRIDGGEVAAISDTELRYVKSGKNVVLKMPKG
ncbi:hypothetical protein [Shimia sp.]|uniref:hypothetical protein n=1 Tax=Shimia sp. TaxID=1954381 RepID=UPI003565B315